MRCDTCNQDSPLLMRVVIAKDYNRALARPIFNCPACFEQKEQLKQRSGLGARGSGQLPPAPTPQPPAKRGS